MSHPGMLEALIDAKVLCPGIGLFLVEQVSQFRENILVSFWVQPPCIELYSCDLRNAQMLASPCHFCLRSTATEACPHVFACFFGCPAACTYTGHGLLFSVSIRNRGEMS